MMLWLQRLRAELMRLAGRFSGSESPWDRITMPVPVTAFGPGSHRQFADYFEGDSGVPVRAVRDVVDWLCACEYVTDVEQFHERDLWQHPRAFEQLRRGDCEDFALWAWRKLAEIGVQAEFYVGRVVCSDAPEVDRHHAWVVYRAGGEDMLFEPALRDPDQMIRPLADVMDRYVPYFAINHRLDTFAFVGCILDADRHQPRHREPAGAA
jgi:hypothetical protein